MNYSVTFPTGTTEYYLKSSYSQLLQVAPSATAIIVTDDNINNLYGHLFTDYKILIIKPGEKSKTWETVQLLTEKLARFEIHKNSIIIGLGGGMITDVVGFLATIYMRGVNFAFVPTSLLGMVDAAIGGKNGVNVQQYKNMLGSIHQPKFILYDNTFLDTLPDIEWSNGFAEIIKYACIYDAEMYNELEESTYISFKIRKDKMNALIDKCVHHKNTIVLKDEQENGLRKILNFGHTAGHSFESNYQLKHGQAVALGMIVAIIASEIKLNLPKEIRSSFIRLLKSYSLPISLEFDIEKVLNTIKLDKKRSGNHIDFILIESVGKAVIHPLTFDEIRQSLQMFADECKA